MTDDQVKELGTKFDTEIEFLKDTFDGKQYKFSGRPRDGGTTSGAVDFVDEDGDWKIKFF